MDVHVPIFYGVKNGKSICCMEIKKLVNIKNDNNNNQTIVAKEKEKIEKSKENNDNDNNNDDEAIDGDKKRGPRGFNEINEEQRTQRI